MEFDRNGIRKVQSLHMEQYRKEPSSGSLMAVSVARVDCNHTNPSNNNDNEACTFHYIHGENDTTVWKGKSSAFTF